MAARPDLPRVEGRRPSYFNSAATALGVVAGAAGFFAAPLLFPAAAGVASTIGGVAAPIALAAIAGIAGAAIGGVFGKSRMNREAAQGRVVREPGFLNKGLVNGLFLGGAIALGLAAAPALLPAATIAAAPWLFGTGAIAASLAGVTALGSYFGARTQAREFTASYNTAKAIEVSRQADTARAEGLGQYLDDPSKVTKTDVAKLNAAMDAGRDGVAPGKFTNAELARDIASQSLAK